MSQRNVQIVSAFFDAAGEVGEAAEAFLAEDAEFVPFTRLAGSGSRGPEGFTRQVAEIADQFAEYEVRPEQLRPAGDHVVAALRRQARSARSPVPLADRFAQVFTLHEGKIVRIQSYPSFDEALEAVGLRD
jgi:ketosteroid isomerase-like protein